MEQSAPNTLSVGQSKPESTPQPVTSTSSQAIKPKSPKKRGGVITILAAVFFIVFILGYFNVIPLAKLFPFLPKAPQVEDGEEKNTIASRAILEEVFKNQMLTNWSGDVKGRVVSVSGNSVKLASVNNTPGVKLTIIVPHNYFLEWKDKTKPKQTQTAFGLPSTNVGDIVYGNVTITKQNNKWTITATTDLYIDRQSTTTKDATAPKMHITKFATTAFITSSAFQKIYAHTQGTIATKTADTLTIQDGTSSLVMTVVEPGGKSRFTKKEGIRVTLYHMPTLHVGDTLDGSVAITTVKSTPTSDKTAIVGDILATVFSVQ